MALSEVRDLVNDVVWSQDFWLPPNITWAEIAPSRTLDSCKFADLGYPLVFALGIIALKFVLEKNVFRILGRAIGLKDGKRSLPPKNDVLEAEYSSSRKLDQSSICRLAKKLDMSERKIERWLRQRSLFGKASKLDKFCESAWKALFYSAMYASSWLILWDKKWFWSITDCWYRYPYHNLTDGIWFFYMAELSFYWSLLITQFFDVQRSDFYEMFCHHVATISLLSLSWICNLFKVGTLVLWVHDGADVFLELAKMFKYSGKEFLSDMLFYGFAICWMVTRLGYFPTWIIYSITVEAPQFIQYFPAYNVFALLLSILLILNLFWAYYIFKVAYIALLTPEGKIERDLRSESASSD